ncbi:MAG: TIGR00725 family protein [Desulfobacterales bacterium]|nr:TIGR00725 family protein [Desulfobacterales bacterium]
MGAKTIIGVMGGGAASEGDAEAARLLGRLIAERGWILLNGGRPCGIMEASARGAREAGGLTLGVLPDENRAHASGYIDIPVMTGMGNARNCINVLTSHVVVACRGGAGTLSEIALALKCGRPVILLNFDVGSAFDAHVAAGVLHHAGTPEEAMEKIDEILRSLH